MGELMGERAAAVVERAGAGGPGNAHARQVELILGEIENLPTLSPIAQRLLAAGSRDDVDLDELIMLIEADPALSATMLGLCRRAEVGLGRRIATVRQAVVLLGLEAVRSAVLGVQVYEVMTRQAAEREASLGGGREAGARGTFDRRGLWRHSIAVACCSEILCERAGGRVGGMHVRPQEAFVAGLLHDLGKVVLDLVLPRAYSRVVGLAEVRRSDSASIERAVIGLDHHTAGKRLCDRWELPEVLGDVIWLHSQPFGSLPDVEHRPLIELVTVARAVTRSLHLGWSGDFGEVPDAEELSLRMGLGELRLEAWAEKLTEAMVERSRLLGLDEQTPPRALLEAIGRANRRLRGLNEALSGRSREADDRAAALDAVAAFHGEWRAASRLDETLRAIGRSARQRLGGAGFMAVVYQSRESEPWEVHVLGGVGRSPEVVSLPASNAGRAVALAGLLEPARMAGLAVKLLPWLSARVPGMPEATGVELVPLTASGEPGQPAALLVVEWAGDARVGEGREGRGGAIDRVRALLPCWSAAVLTASRGELMRALSEALAATNRSLSEAQARLTEQESLARLGQMSAGAAHEMNTPLTVIRGRSQLLERRLVQGPEKAAARSIAEAAEQISDLITAMNLLADPPEPVLASCEVLGLVQGSIGEARRRASRRGEGDTGAVEQDAERWPCEVKMEVSGSRIRVDRELVGKALTEVIVNAFEAESRGPVVVRVQGEGAAGRLVISVTDRGRGMTKRALKHAFDPFFSEKPAGRQTGLGLTRARRLIELHGGEIRLSSAEGKGTTATISLPVGETSDAAPKRIGAVGRRVA